MQLNESMITEREKIEDVLIHAAGEFSECAYSRFAHGEMSNEELERVYSILRRWTEESQLLLSILR